MTRLAPSGAAIAMATLLLVPLVGAASPSSLAKSVGEILVDAQGRAMGANLEGKLGQTPGVLEDLRTSRQVIVFKRVHIEGFEATEPISGAGTPLVEVRGSNAVVSLHDDLHSAVKIAANSPTTIVYTLAEGVSATRSGANGATIQLTHATAGAIGALVAYAGEGPASRGETLQVKGSQIIASLQSGSELIFLDASRPIIEALADGALASQYVTEFGASGIFASQVDSGTATARTTTEARGFVQTTLATKRPALLSYDLAYETLPTTDAQSVSAYLDGEIMERVENARDVLARSRSGAAVFHAESAQGRTQVLASSPPGDHRVAVSVGTQASTEPQARAEQDANEDSRVYGHFEYHPNGKLTGEFLTSVIPDGRAHLLSFTALATRTEIFRSVTVDGGAAASFHTADTDKMRLASPRADLTLVDDVHATFLLVPKAAVQAAFELAPNLRATPSGDDIIRFDGPEGSAGALVLVGKGTLTLDAGGTIRADLGPGSTLIYRGAADEHLSEPAILRAIADGRVGAQFLAGVQNGASVTKATSYSTSVDPVARVLAHGALDIAYTVSGESERAFVLDVRGAALAARSTNDLRVNIDGVTVTSSGSVEDVLDVVNTPRYFATTSLDGALRLIISTASRAGETAHITIESIVQEAAEAQARTDAFGEFRLFHDGAAVGSFVTFKADKNAGAVTGLTLVATAQPIFTSFVAGRSSYHSVSGDGASVLKLENREARVTISDSTNAFTKLSAREPTDAAFHLAAGLRAAPRSSGVIEILDAGGEHVGSLVAARAATLEARGEREIRASLALGGEVLFRTHDGIERELSAAQRTMINQAIAAGRVAGQVTVQTQANAAVTTDALGQTARGAEESVAIAAARAFGQVTSSVSASYGDVQMVTTATKARVDITLASASGVGKTLLISLDPDTIPGMATGKAMIRFDGEVVAQASSYADILDADDDSGVAEYFVLAGEAGTQVLVSIPHWSVHTVTLQEQEVRNDSYYLYATIFLGLLVIVESALLARARTKRAAASAITNNRRP